MATRQLNVVDVQFKGMVDAFRQTVRINGWVGLWRGTVANLIKVAPYSGFMFMSFEAAKRGFIYYNGYTVSPWKDKAKPGVDQSLKPHELYHSASK